MNVLFAAATKQYELVYVWHQATPEAKAIIATLVVFSIVAWSVMASKAVQMRKAKKLNQLFNTEFRRQTNARGIDARRIRVEGCPLFAVYQQGSAELDARLKSLGGEGRKVVLSLKAMEHVKRTLERSVAQESLKLESGLIL